MKLEEISPIWVITDETIQSKKGDISFVYKVEFPEVYLLSAEDYDLFNSVFTKAVNMFSTGTIVSRYDFVYPESHRSEPDLKSFIDRSNCRFWGERPFMQSESYFVFTKTARIEKKSYYNTTLNSKAGLFEKSQYDLEEISLFKIDIENFIEAIINTSTHQLKKVKFSQLITFNELYEFVFERFLYMGIDGIRKNLSVEFNDQDDNATVGDNLVTVLSMNSNGYPPELFSSIVDGDVEVPGISELEVSTLHKVGFKLDFPHIIVNAIYTLDQKGEKERLAGAIKTFQSLSGSMYNNEMKHSIEDFLGAVTSEPTLKVVEHHFGLIITTPEYQKELHNKRLSRACSTLAEMDVRYTKNLFNSLNSLFSYCPGNTNDIAQCDRGVVLTQHAACFNIWENNQKTS